MRRHSLVLAAVFAGACGLADPLGELSLGLPQKPFVIDSADWNLAVEGTFPAVPCSAGCAATTFCPDGSCTAECDGASCRALVRVAVYQKFELAVEVPALQAVDGEASIVVSLGEVRFRVLENSLNISTPALRIFAAPIDVTDPASPGAIAIGEIAPVAPLATGEVQVTLQAGGKAGLEQFMASFRAPFNLIVAGELELSAWDPVPQGRLAGAVEAAATGDTIS